MSEGGGWTRAGTVRDGASGNGLQRQLARVVLAQLRACVCSAMGGREVCGREGRAHVPPARAASHARVHAGARPSPPPPSLPAASSTGLKVLTGAGLAAALVLVVAVGVHAAGGSGGSPSSGWQGDGGEPLATFLAVSCGAALTAMRVSA